MSADSSMHRSLQILLALAIGALVVWYASLPGPENSAVDHRERLAFDLDGPALLEGRALLDPGVPAGAVRIELRYQEDWGTPMVSVGVDAEGTFQFERLMPGKARLAARAQGREEPLAVLEGVVVGAQHEPYVLDLRDTLFVVPIEIFSPGGEPVPEALVAWRPSGDGTFDHFGLAKDGQLVLAMPVEPIDLYVQSRGVRSQLVRRVVGATSVSLRPSLAVELSLPPGVDPKADRVKLHGAVVRNRAPARLQGSLHAVTDYLRVVDRVDLSDGGPARVEVPSGGSYRVEWRVFDADQDHLLPFPGSPEASPFEVRASEPGATIVPPFPEALYRAALAAR